jgi:myosin-3
MLRAQHSQVCVISGESGAGKTESAKLFVRHIVTLSSRKVTSASHGGTIERRIIEMSPILEAFGNAVTVMNDNSSRFGKYVELQVSCHRSCFELISSSQPTEA